MSTQLTLLPAEPFHLKPEINRPEPAVWVRELRILRDLRPGKDFEVRSISLQPGLNILLARSPKPADEATDDATAAISGHASGKTSFCRLVRYALGEATFGSEELRNRVRQKFPTGWLVAEVVVAGVDWLVVRPLGLSYHPFATRGARFSDLFHPEFVRGAYADYETAIADACLGPLPVRKFPASRENIGWNHLLPWLARDQECRYSELTDWRHKSTDAKSPDLDNDDRHFVLRAVLGLIDADEEEELRRNAEIVGKKQAAEKQAPLLRFKALADETFVRTALPDVASGLGGELYFDTVERALNEQLPGINAELATVAASPALVPLRESYDIASRVYSVEQEHLDAFERDLQQHELELKVYKGESPQSELDDYLRSKPPAEGFCRVKVEDARRARCPMWAGRPIPIEEGRAQSKEDQDGAELEKRVMALRKELAHMRLNVAGFKRNRDDAWAEFTAEVGRQSEATQKLSARRTRIENLIETVQRARQANKDAETEEAAIADWESKRLASIARQGRLREEQIKACGQFSESYDSVIKFILDKDTDGTVSFFGRQLRLHTDRHGDLTSAAIDTIRILAFDLAALKHSCAGSGNHPRFLLHDGPREADMAAPLYRKFFHLVKKMEDSFPEGSTPNFQYIITTTEPPPTQLDGAPWVIDPVLDGAREKGRLYGINL